MRSPLAEKPLIETGVRRFTYLYDFGDDWERRIFVEERSKVEHSISLIQRVFRFRRSDTVNLPRTCTDCRSPRG